MSNLNEVAAELVVSATGSKADYYRLEDAIAALGAGGGRIFVKRGTYTVPAGGYIMPDADVEIVCAGRGATVFTRAAGGAGVVFSMGFDRYYRFSGFTILGDDGATAQTAFIRTAAASAKRIKIQNVNVGSTLVSADGLLTIMDSGGLQTNWDVTDCNFQLPPSPAVAFLLAGSATDDVFLNQVRTAGRASVSGSPIIRAVEYRTSITSGTWAIGSGSLFTSCEITLLIMVGVIGTFCRFVNCVILGTHTAGTSTGFIGCVLTSFSAAGDNIRIIGCAVGAGVFTSTGFSRHVIVGNRGTYTLTFTDTSDCIVTGNSEITYSEAGTSNGNILADNKYPAGVPPVGFGADTIVEGSRLASFAAATVDAFTTVFTRTGPKGLLGIGTIKNTGADGLNIRETVTDAFGVVATVTTLVAALGDYMLDIQTNFVTARPPHVSYMVEVQSAVAGLPTTYDLRFAAQGSVT